MTEYDFSPEAYERYMESQRRIGQWVDDARIAEPLEPFVISRSDEGLPPVIPPQPHGHPRHHGRWDEHERGRRPHRDLPRLHVPPAQEDHYPPLSYLHGGGAARSRHLRGGPPRGPPPSPADMLPPAGHDIRLHSPVGLSPLHAGGGGSGPLFDDTHPHDPMALPPPPHPHSQRNGTPYPMARSLSNVTPASSYPHNNHHHGIRHLNRSNPALSPTGHLPMSQSDEGHYLTPGGPPHHLDHDLDHDHRYSSRPIYHSRSFQDSSPPPHGHPQSHGLALQLNGHPMGGGGGVGPGAVNYYARSLSRSSGYSFSSLDRSYGHSRSRSRSRSRSYSPDPYHSPGAYYGGGGPGGAVGRWDAQQGYQTVHPSATLPTVITPSSTHPIVVPLAGGGYVVVPAQGQSLQVLDPRYPHVLHSGTPADLKSRGPSFFDRISRRLGSRSRHRDRRRDDRYYSSPNAYHMYSD